MQVFVFAVLLLIFDYCLASTGDNSHFFINCVDKCTIKECEDGGEQFTDPDSQPFYLKLLMWSCGNECEYQCMWRTVEAFEKRGYAIPQFYGKWPFIRILGIQEPASVIFSLMNFYAHYKCLRNFRRKVRMDSPLYWLWHLYSLVCMNAWIWSTVFHARDFPSTEFMDYSFAFSIILMMCYAMTVRLLRDIPRSLLIMITTFFVAFYANHVAYLKIGRFDYAYNLQVNILVGAFSAIVWFAWCTYNRHRQPYVWKCGAFVSLTGLVTLLEVIDRAPYFHTFDHHALWHLSTAPLTYLFYSFVIDDCIYLRKQVIAEDKVVFAHFVLKEKELSLMCFVIVCAICIYVPVIFNINLLVSFQQQQMAA